ncbi:hypothetical protein SM39_1802 [Serratia marcescens SM39]|uniref:Uncharacterized protein n=1 Tax=Serratia marcescens SM39 TaxID=1334564 RepID=A0AAT9EGS1_SERMA|nr:hypothetical protein SM39_1802 [Serratia marcescens SM39]
MISDRENKCRTAQTSTGCPPRRSPPAARCSDRCDTSKYPPSGCRPPAPVPPAGSPDLYLKVHQCIKTSI